MLFTGTVSLVGRVLLLTGVVLFRTGDVSLLGKVVLLIGVVLF